MRQRGAEQREEQEQDSREVGSAVRSKKARCNEGFIRRPRSKKKDSTVNGAEVCPKGPKPGKPIDETMDLVRLTKEIT